MHGNSSSLMHKTSDYYRSIRVNKPERSSRNAHASPSHISIGSSAYVIQMYKCAKVPHTCRYKPFWSSAFRMNRVAYTSHTNTQSIARAIVAFTLISLFVSLLLLFRDHNKRLHHNFYYDYIGIHSWKQKKTHQNNNNNSDGDDGSKRTGRYSVA